MRQEVGGATVLEETRACARCGETKPINDDFYLPIKSRPGRFHSACRDCMNASARHRAAARRKACGPPCACGCGAFPPSVSARYIIGHFRPRGQLGVVRSKPATRHPTLMEIAWAAGIYEGEGSAGYSGISVGQRDRWILDKYQMLFGGHVKYDPKVEMHYWRASGTRARGFLMTIYSFLSPWRQAQAVRALRTLGTHPHRKRSRRERPRAFPARRRRADPPRAV